jgi:regulatory protein
MKNNLPQKLTPSQALEKIKHYCAYQERCHSEVREKLFDYGLNKNESDEILLYLIENNFLDEQRYAEQFAGGHFRRKKWGRIKIRYALRQKQISDPCIKKALQVIDEEDYMKTLQQLFDEKKNTLRSEKNHFIRKKKIRDHLLQKGYEAGLIQDLLKE